MFTTADLLVSQPGVLVSQLVRHAGHYATLTQLEAEMAASQWLRRALAGGVALLGAALALMLGGVAVMLAASHFWASGSGPGTASALPVVYWLVPALPVSVALVAAALVLRHRAPTFELLRQQLHRDLQLLDPAVETP